MTTLLNNTAITDITLEILSQANLATNVLTRKLTNACSENMASKIGKCNVPNNLPTPEPKWVLQNVTNKRESYVVPFKTIFKRIVRPVHLLELTNQDLSRIEEPVYSDIEIGFGAKWQVNDLETDDDQYTPRSTIDKLTKIVGDDLLIVLADMSKLGVSQFNMRLKGYKRFKRFHN
jgi:hypothetical protein